MTTPKDRSSDEPDGAPAGDSPEPVEGRDDGPADLASDGADAGGEISAIAGMADSPLPFVDLRQPQPIPAPPPGGARWLAFASVLVGGLLGGMIGYGTADLLAGGIWAAAGALVGGVIGAVGVGVVAGLALRAMNEWSAVHHPEAEDGPRSSRAGRRQAARPGRRR